MLCPYLLAIGNRIQGRACLKPIDLILRQRVLKLKPLFSSIGVMQYRCYLLLRRQILYVTVCLMQSCAYDLTRFDDFR